jgi:hypothetical protein
MILARRPYNPASPGDGEDSLGEALSVTVLITEADFAAFKGSLVPISTKPPFLLNYTQFMPERPEHKVFPFFQQPRSAPI